MKGQRIRITKINENRQVFAQELVGKEGTVLEHDFWDGRIWVKLDKPFPPYEHNAVILPGDDFEYI